MAPTAIAKKDKSKKKKKREIPDISGAMSRPISGKETKRKLAITVPQAYHAKLNPLPKKSLGIMY